MAERLAPDTLALQDNLSGAVTDIDDDPDAPDANWLTVVDNTVDTDARVTFPTPSGNLDTGAGLQEFRALIRKDSTAGNDPTYEIELWENGALVLTLVGPTALTDADGELVVSATWDAALLSNVDGSLVECRVHGVKASGQPATRRAVEVGAVEWNAEVVATIVEVPTGVLSVTGFAPDVQTPVTTEIPTAVLSVTGFAPRVTRGVFWDEKLEADPGYDETWSEGESLVGTGTLDEDFLVANLTSPPGDWGVQCLEADATGGSVEVKHFFASEQGPPHYWAFDIIVDTASVDAGTDDIANALTSGGLPAWNLQLPKSGGEVSLRFVWFDSGGSSIASNTDLNLVDQQRHRIQIKWDTVADEAEWSIDGVRVERVTGIAAREMGQIKIGRPTGGGGIVYFDNLTIRDDTWVHGAPAVAEPGTASLTITGFAPTAETPITVEVPAASLSVTAFAPAFETGTSANIEVPTGSINVTGQPPTALTVASNVEVGAVEWCATLAAAGAVTITVPTASISVTGFAPSVELPVTTEVPAGALVLSGFAPVAETPVTVEVPAGSLQVQGFAPAAETPVTVTVPTASIEVAGFAPSVEISATIDVPTASLAVTGLPPGFDTAGATTVPTGALQVTGFAPAFETGVTTEVPAATLEVSGFAPSFQTGVTTEVPTAALTVVGQAPSFSTSATIDIPTASVQIVGLAPSVELPVTTSVPTGAIELAAFAPDIQTPVSVEVPTASVTLTGFAPSADVSFSVTVPTASLNVAGLAPTFQTGVTTTVPTASVTITGQVPTVELPISVEVPNAAITITGFAPVVTEALVVTPGTGTIVLTGLAPDLAGAEAPYVPPPPELATPLPDCFEVS